MKDLRIGTRYAGALLALAEEHEELERIEKELQAALALVERYPEISQLLRNTTLSREEKESFIEKILPAGSSSLLVNFFKVLVKKKRFQDFPLIQDRFHRYYEERKGLQRVQVTSVVSLDETLQSKLRRALEKKLNRKVDLEIKVAPEILGGLILDFDGTQIDGSFRTALYELKQKLLS